MIDILNNIKEYNELEIKEINDKFFNLLAKNYKNSNTNYNQFKINLVNSIKQNNIDRLDSIKNDMLKFGLDSKEISEALNQSLDETIGFIFEKDIKVLDLLDKNTFTRVINYRLLIISFLDTLLNIQTVSAKSKLTIIFEAFKTRLKFI